VEPRTLNSWKFLHVFCASFGDLWKETYSPEVSTGFTKLEGTA
jgi:hypothetical protein